MSSNTVDARSFANRPQSLQICNTVLIVRSHNHVPRALDHVDFGRYGIRLGICQIVPLLVYGSYLPYGLP